MNNNRKIWIYDLENDKIFLTDFEWYDDKYNIWTTHLVIDEYDIECLIMVEIDKIKELRKLLKEVWQEIKYSDEEIIEYYEKNYKNR